MNTLDLDAVCQYVNDNVQYFHDRKIASLEGLTLNRLLQKNPYLFKAKNITLTSDLMQAPLGGLSFLVRREAIRRFLGGIGSLRCRTDCRGAQIGSARRRLGVHQPGYTLRRFIKSGPNWGNSSQHRRLAQDLRDAVTRVKQSRTTLKVQPVLGICYGKTRSCHTTDGYWKVVGQNFWYLISENQQLYTDIIEPIGYRAKEHNEAFLKQAKRRHRNFQLEFDCTFQRSREG